MQVKIYHNPRCSKSRLTLDLLKSKGIEPEVIEYLDTPPDETELRDILQKLSMEPQAILRARECKEEGVDPQADSDTLIKAIVKHPGIMERPIVITDKGARICRPPELAEEIL